MKTYVYRFITKKCDCFFTENLCIQILLQKSVTVFLLKTYVYRFYYKKKCGVFLLKTYVYRFYYKNQRLSRACIVHLVIKKNNWSYVKTMSCSGSHLGITINIKNTKFVKDLPMIDAQFRFNQCNSFREEYISVFSPVLIL